MHHEIEDSLIVELAHSAKRITLDNQNKPNRPSLNEADQADMEVFLSNILQILPLLGISAFERPTSSKGSQKNRLHISAKGVKAEGYESTEGFVVCRDSGAVKASVPSMKTHVLGMYDLREKLITSGVLVLKDDHYQFMQDYVFSSPSTAAAVILGRSANGRVEWKNKSGKTLKAIQEAVSLA